MYFYDKPNDRICNLDKAFDQLSIHTLTIPGETSSKYGVAPTNFAVPDQSLYVGTLKKCSEFLTKLAEKLNAFEVRTANRALTLSRPRDEEVSATNPPLYFYYKDFKYLDSGQPTETSITAPRLTRLSNEYGVISMQTNLEGSNQYYIYTPDTSEAIYHGTQQNCRKIMEQLAKKLKAIQVHDSDGTIKLVEC